MTLRLALLAMASTAALAGTASAAPITVSPGSLTANGTVTAVFAFADAGDTSTLSRVNVAGTIFKNNGNGADAVGTTKTLSPANTGLIQFALTNMSMGYTFINDVADTGAGGDTYYHAKYGTSASDFGVTFTAAANTAIANLPGPVILVGFEDRRGGDYDYNDLIFAFSSVRATAVPEPVSMALLGTGLLGIGLVRCRRAN